MKSKAELAAAAMDAVAKYIQGIGTPQASNSQTYNEMYLHWHRWQSAPPDAPAPAELPKEVRELISVARDYRDFFKRNMKDSRLIDGAAISTAYDAYERATKLYTFAEVLDKLKAEDNGRYESKSCAGAIDVHAVNRNDRYSIAAHQAKDWRRIK